MFSKWIGANIDTPLNAQIEMYVFNLSRQTPLDYSAIPNILCVSWLYAVHTKCLYVVLCVEHIFSRAQYVASWPYAGEKPRIRGTFQRCNVTLGLMTWYHFVLCYWVDVYNPKYPTNLH